MQTSTWTALTIIITTSSLLYLLHIYKDLPSRIASQFDINGEPGLYLPKATIFILPILQLGIGVLLHYLPKRYPPRGEHQHFLSECRLFSLVFQGFIAYITILILLWNLGTHLNMLRYVMFGVGVLFLFGGRIQLNSKPNRFVGVRTAWTLENERNWDQVNKPAGYIFYASAVFCIAGSFISAWLALSGIGVLVAGLIGLSVYSYIQSKRVKRD